MRFVHRKSHLLLALLALLPAHLSGTPGDTDNDGLRDSVETNTGMLSRHRIRVGVPGRTYRVEESSNLSTWTIIPELAQVVVTSPQPAASVAVPANGEPKRFHRMQVMLTQ